MTDIYLPFLVDFVRRRVAAQLALLDRKIGNPSAELPDILQRMRPVERVLLAAISEKMSSADEAWHINVRWTQEPMAIKKIARQIIKASKLALTLTSIRNSAYCKNAAALTIFIWEGCLPALKADGSGTTAELTLICFDPNEEDE